ncbi:MAG: DUF1028 domain-containing protein [Planctomycetes bacterium]|nr:DUF1028 domain-containing protein [Planctomycetota bacterium]
MIRIKKLISAMVALAVLAAQATATWSICIVNTRTGEICVASATCVPGSDLMLWTPMMLPDIGVAVCQAASPQEMKVVMQEYMLLGHSPKRLKNRVDNKFGNVGARQYAIIDMEGRYLVHTGDTNGSWAGHLTGQLGDMVYTIQGNVLAGEAVITEAELALLNTPGDMSQKVMAAMEAAMSMGGDGRCSCDTRFPDSCGTPPPNFTQTATIGFMLIARAGDSSGACSASGGCANGDFFMRLNEPNHTQPGTDPVILLRADYDAWRLSQSGRPDGLNSLVVADTDRVQPVAELVNYWIELYDIDGVGISHGGANVTLEHRRGSAGLATLHSVTDHGDGTYSLQVQPGATPGLDEFAFRVDDGSGANTALLMPSQKLLHQAPTVAPMGVGTAVGGLSTVVEIRAAHVMADGLRVWMIADDGDGGSGGGSNGNGFQLLRADRASLNAPFGDPVVVDIENTDSERLETLFVSDDELQLTISARAELGVPTFYTTRREAIIDPFPEPKVETELTSALGDGDPWISKNGLAMYFTSGRDGERRLYRATRLTSDALWYPPHELATLHDGHAKADAILIDHDTRLLYSDENTTRTGQRHADVLPNGNFELRGLMPGEAVKTVDMAGVNADGSMIWRLHPAAMVGAGPQQLMQCSLATSSFSVSPQSVSAGAGGILNFELAAGAEFANSTYEILVGNPGAGMKWNGHVLPIKHNWNATGLVHNLIASGDQAWQDFRGTLDANGQTSVTLTLAPGAVSNPNLIGTTLAFCFVADPGGEGFVSQAVWIELQN